MELLPTNAIRKIVSYLGMEDILNLHSLESFKKVYNINHDAYLALNKSYTHFPTYDSSIDYVYYAKHLPQPSTDDDIYILYHDEINDPEGYDTLTNLEKIYRVKIPDVGRVDTVSDMITFSMWVDKVCSDHERYYSYMPLRSFVESQIIDRQESILLTHAMPIVRIGFWTRENVTPPPIPLSEKIRTTFAFDILKRYHKFTFPNYNAKKNYNYLLKYFNRKYYAIFRQTIHDDYEYKEFDTLLEIKNLIKLYEDNSDFSLLVFAQPIKVMLNLPGVESIGFDYFFDLFLEDSEDPDSEDPDSIDSD